MNPNSNTKYVVIGLVVILVLGAAVFYFLIQKQNSGSSAGRIDPNQIRSDISEPGPTLSGSEEARVRNDISKPPNITSTDSMGISQSQTSLSEEEKAKIRSELK